MGDRWCRAPFACWSWRTTRHGKLPWAQLFGPAIALAEGGFKVSARLNTPLASEAHLKKDPACRRLFYDAQGKPWPVGHVLKNPELAQVLRGIAAQGPRPCSKAPAAQAMVDKVPSTPTTPARRAPAGPGPIPAQTAQRPVLWITKPGTQLPAV